jgi:hypothetical protein
LTVLGNRSTGYRAKPRLLTYGKTFLLDIPFTIIFINIPNICVSLIINIENIGTSDILSLVMGIFSIFLVLTMAVIFIVKKH